MRHWIVVLMCFVVLGAMGFAAMRVSRHDHVAVQPREADWLTLDELRGFRVEPLLRIVRDPSDPTGVRGLVDASIGVETLLEKPLRDVQLTFWMPPGVGTYVRIPVGGTFTPKHRAVTIAKDSDLRGVQPGRLWTFPAYDDEAQRAAQIDAFRVGMTRAHLTWKGGGATFQFPFSAWKIVLVPDPRDEFDGQVIKEAGQP